jgi:hypothetical protein
MPKRPLTPLGWVRSQARRLPPIARRDKRIRTLTAQNKRLAQRIKRYEREQKRMGTPQADVPSFYRQSYATGRINQHAEELGIPGGIKIARKLRAYSFAQSHGVRIPALYGLWHTPEEIAWDELPDRVTIKSHTGASSRGVFPLRRSDDRWAIVTKPDPVTTQELVAQLRRLYDDGRVDGPYFAEELLDGGRDGTLPTEVRVFSFYGEVGLVNVRQPSDHGNPAGTAVRRFLPDGTDGPRHPDHDESIERPKIFDEFIGVAKRLSLAIPRPFVRIDMYDIDGDIVFGELTPRPGGSQDLGPETDRRLGELWERAQARVHLDVVNGGTYTLTFGPGPQALQIGDEPYLPDEAGSPP